MSIKSQNDIFSLEYNLFSNYKLNFVLGDFIFSYKCFCYSVELWPYSDTNWYTAIQSWYWPPQIRADSIVIGSVLYKTTPNSDEATGAVPRPPLFDHWLQIWGLPWYPQVQHFIRTTWWKLGKHYTYDHNFIIKDTDQDQPNKEKHRVRSGWALNTELLCSFPVEPACHPTIISMCSPTKKFLWASVSRIFIRVSLQQHDWLNHRPHD